MSMTDSLADLLTRIRNGNQIYKTFVDAPYSVFKKEVVEVLKAEKYIRDYEVLEEAGKKRLRVHLLYLADRKRAITEIRRMSRPGRRSYTGRHTIPSIKDGLGVAVLSTSRGVLTDRKAQEIGIGGELLFYVW